MSLEGTAMAENVLRGTINGLKTINGYSAYEVAVINGFKGTEEEWLASLHGIDAKHKWDGTVLTITSANGTSSADLKGEKGDDKVFVAVYGETTYAEIKEEYDAGKVILCVYPDGGLDSGDVVWGASGTLFPMSSISDTKATFTGNADNDFHITLYVTSTSGSKWQAKGLVLQTASRLTNEISADSSSIKYPSAKAVYDADKVITDSVKPYTDYWWYAPGKGTQDGYEQKVEENFSHTVEDDFDMYFSMNGGMSSGDMICWYYADSIEFDTETGRYRLIDHEICESTAPTFAGTAQNTCRNKYVARSYNRASEVVYVNDEATLTTKSERLEDGAVLYHFLWGNVTRYTNAPHYGDYVSSPDETTYEGVEGYTLLGTVADVAVDTHEEVRDMKEVRPDWNQNDRTAADYIKNKPFGDGEDTTFVVPETEVVIDLDIGTGEFQSQYAIIEEKNYTVEWDGETYVCQSTIGNGWDGSEDFTTVDLVVSDYLSIYYYGDGRYVVFFGGDPGTHTLSIYTGSGVKKLDGKYLPTETWTFTLEDGSTVKKKVVVAE